MDKKNECRAAEKLFLEYKLEDAFREFLKLAESGNGRAMYFLGEYYFWGYKPVEKDLKAAEEWRRKGMEAGDVLAKLNFAVSLPEVDPNRSKYFHEIWDTVVQMAELGDVFAQDEAANVYQWGIEIPKDREQAIKWYLRAANAGFWRTYHDLAYCYWENEDYEKALKWDRLAADHGSLWACVCLGDAYSTYSKGVDMDEYTAAEWYRKAAEGGLAAGQERLADCYEYGDGVRPDKKEAMKWNEMAAKQGQTGAQLSLGDYYSDETNPDADLVKAAHWYEKSAKKGNLIAQCRLADAYHKGSGVERDEQKALELYLKAAGQNDAWAQSSLADYYLSEGPNHNVEEAIKWYIKAGEKGSGDTLNSVADLYWEGNGIKQNYAEAVKWYSKGVERDGIGVDHAAYRLATAYRYGYGVEKDDEKALHYYLKAIENALVEEPTDAIHAVEEMFVEAKRSVK